MIEKDILRIDSRGKKEFKDSLTEEVPLTIFLNDEEVLTILCSPENLKELSLGFLYSSGLISSLVDVESVTIDSKKKASPCESSMVFFIGLYVT